MSNLANKFLEAMEIISDSSIASAEFDRSIQVQIDRLKNELDSRTYIVKYNGIEYTAIGTPGYLRGENVWAVVPKGDFTQNLQILGLVSDESISSTIVNKDYVRYETLNNLAVIDSVYTDIGDNRTITIFDEDTDEWGLRDELTLIINTINTYLAFEIGMEITSNIRKRWDDNEDVSEEKFKELMQNINYGIRFKFNAYEFVFDMNDLQGNPYFSTNIRQTKIFTIPEKNDSLKLEKIELFFTDLKEGDSVTLENFTFSGCREANRQSGLTADLEVVKNNRHIKVLNETFGAYTLKENDGESVISLNATLRQDDVLIQENNLSNYSFAWYIKTHEFATPARLINPDYSLTTTKFIGDTKDWDVIPLQDDPSKYELNKYKGSSNIVYLPSFVGNYSITKYNSSLFENMDFIEALVIKKIDSDKAEVLSKLTDKAVLYTKEEVSEVEINHRVVYGQFLSLDAKAPKDWEMFLPRDMFFGRKTWVQCKVIENNTKSKAETDLGLFIDLTKSEPNISTGIIRKGSQEKEDPSRWYQTIELSLDANKNIWFKDNKRTNIHTSTVNVEINASLDQVWLGQLLTKTNFLIAQEEWLIMSQPYATSNLIITGDSLFRLREDGSWIGDQPKGEVKANLTLENEPVEPEDNIEYEWFCSSGNQTYLQSITPAEDPSVAYFTLKQQKYSSAYNNNIIYCVAYQRREDGERRKVGEGEFNLSFLTNGQPGTNGTNYICRLTFDGGVSFPEYLISTESYGAGRIEVKNIQKGNVIVLDEESISYKYENGDSVQLAEGLINTGLIDFENHKYIYAEASDGVSSFSTYLPLIYVPDSSIIKLVEPFSQPVIVFSSSGTIASGLPLVFTLESSETDAIDVSINSSLLSAATLKSNNNTSVYVELQEAFTKFDKIVACETLEVTSGEDEDIALLASIPIILLVNRFENAEINAWNGAEVKIDDNTVLALSAGFGKKETDGSFTGVVLGSCTEMGENETKETHGLFGFNKGARSFELNAETGEGRIGGWDLKTEELSNETFYNTKKQEYIDKDYNKEFSMFIKPCYYIPKKDENGNIMKDEDGKTIQELITFEEIKEFEFNTLESAWEYEFSETWETIPEDAEEILFPLYFNSGSCIYSFVLQNVKIGITKVETNEFALYDHAGSHPDYFETPYKTDLQNGQCKIITKNDNPIEDIDETVWIGLFRLKEERGHLNEISLSFTMRILNVPEEQEPPVLFSINSIKSNDNNILSAKAGQKTIFSVNKQGKLFANNAEIKGSIQAQKGLIGGWEINEDKLSYQDTYTNNALALHGNGSISKFGDTTLGITAGTADIKYNSHELTIPPRNFSGSASSRAIVIDMNNYLEQEQRTQENPVFVPWSITISDYHEFSDNSIFYNRTDSVTKDISFKVNYSGNNGYPKNFEAEEILKHYPSYLGDGTEIFKYESTGVTYEINQYGVISYLYYRSLYPTTGVQFPKEELDEIYDDFKSNTNIRYVVTFRSPSPTIRGEASSGTIGNLQAEVVSIKTKDALIDRYQIWILKTEVPTGWTEDGVSKRTQYFTLQFFHGDGDVNSNYCTVGAIGDWGVFEMYPYKTEGDVGNNSRVTYPGYINFYRVTLPKAEDITCEIKYEYTGNKLDIVSLSPMSNEYPLTNYFSKGITDNSNLLTWVNPQKVNMIARIHALSVWSLFAETTDNWKLISAFENVSISPKQQDMILENNKFLFSTSTSKISIGSNTYMFKFRSIYNSGTSDFLPPLFVFPPVNRVNKIEVNRNVSIGYFYPDIRVEGEWSAPVNTENGNLSGAIIFSQCLYSEDGKITLAYVGGANQSAGGSVSIYGQWKSSTYPFMLGKNGRLFLEEQEVLNILNTETLTLSRTIQSDTEDIKLLTITTNYPGLNSFDLYLNPQTKELYVL